MRLHDTVDRQELAWLVVVMFLLLLTLCFGCLGVCSVTFAQEPVGCPQVCPSCNVKAEWTDEGYQYEYTDGTAVITGTDQIVYWQASSGHLVTKVCIKAGQQLYFVTPEGEQQWFGFWQTPWHDISHVVVCAEKPTAIGLASFRAIALPDIGLALFLLGVAGMAFGLYVIVRTRREDG